VKKSTKLKLRIGLLAGVSLVASQMAAAGPSNVAPEVERNAVYTEPISVAWAQVYPSAAANLSATNADGMSNYEKMIALLPPDNQSKVVPANARISTIITSPLLATPSLAQRQQQLHEQAANFRRAAANDQTSLEQRATAAGIPLSVELGDGKVGTLIDIDENGQPSYVAPFDVYGAATTHADQLWPAGSVTAVSGWTTGSSGLNLDGTGQIVDMWEADETLGNAGVQTGHLQFFDAGLGVSRVTQGDSTGISAHATGVAGMLTSAGQNDSYNLTIGSGVNLGNFSRGIGYAGNVNAWSLNSYQGNFLDEAGNGIQLANNSWGIFAGWRYDGTHWIWYGGNNANVTDWQFGAYVGSYTGAQGGNAPRQLDNLSYLSPNTLMVFAAGNSLLVGPGSAVTYYLSTDTTFSSPQTATKNWLDGDAGEYRTISPNASAKNVLSVGGVFSITPGYTTPSDVVLVAPYTAFGPTTDGRIKPEVVAPSAVNSTVTSYNPYGFVGLIEPDTSNPSIPYNEWLGTSFASPAVASGLGLALQERLIVQPAWANNGFPVLSSTLRALAVHTADQAGSNPGPSYTFGYGLFDAENAVNLMMADANTAHPSPPYNGADGIKPYVKETVLPSGGFIQYNVYASSTSTPLKVTLAWTDPQGPAQTTGVANDSTARLVNDLDLRVYPPGTVTFNPSASTTYKPWILNPDLTSQSPTARSAAATTGDDTRNNLEQVVVNSPTTGSPYIVRVTYKGSLNSGQQSASLIMSGNNAVAVPFVVTQFAPQPNGQFLMTWSSTVGGEYSVQTASGIAGPWSDITPVEPAYQENTSTVVTPNAPSQFYRVARYY
jgi:Subtilase family